MFNHRYHTNVASGALPGAHLSPLLRAIPMSFSMPPASLRALAFSMFLVMTSCSAQQMAVTVSSDMVLLGGPVVPEVPLLVVLLLLLLLLPGNRWIKSLMAYLPDGRRKKMQNYFRGGKLAISQPVLPQLHWKSNQTTENVSKK